MKKLTKIEIIRLFYGSEDEVKEPNFQWKNDAEAIGINPEEYVIEKDTMQLVKIYELYKIQLMHILAYIPSYWFF